MVSGGAGPVWGSGAPAGQALDALGDLGPWNGADDLVHDHAVLEEQDGRNRANAEAGREPSLLVDVDLRHRDLAGLIAGDVLEHGSDRPAWPAPRGPEVHDQGGVGGDRLVEVPLAESDACGIGAHVGPPVASRARARSRARWIDTFSSLDARPAPTGAPRAWSPAGLAFVWALRIPYTGWCHLSSSSASPRPAP